MKIQIFTDVWHPQVNGVILTLDMIKRECEKKGHTIDIVHPYLFKNISCPTYPEIKLAINPWMVKDLINSFKPDAIHMATEGPVGIAARLYCHKHNLAYTTAYHTRLPEYIRQRYPIPISILYRIMRWMHKRSRKVLVTTKSMMEELNDKGYKNMVEWGRGVDHDLFNPSYRKDLEFKRPILLCVARVAVEKNLPEFLDMKYPGTKIIVGDGPAKMELEKKYPECVFVGYKKGVELVQYFASADVFVFPSIYDTFGIVLIESMACGTPIAAFDVTGPKDIVENGINGFLGSNLIENTEKCLKLDRKKVEESSAKWNWTDCADVFIKSQIGIHAE